MTPVRSAILLTAVVCAACAQPAGNPPAFEVASVKAVKGGGEGRGGGGRGNVNSGPGSLTMKNVSLKAAVQWAWHVFPYQVTGPGWMETERYDIDAKTAGPSSEEDRRLMLQALLADRFKLAVHRETKELPAYVVTVAKGGPKFHESESEGEPSFEPNGRVGVRIRPVSMAQLVDLLSSIPMLPYAVVDQTGLKGRYDISLDLSSYVGVTSPIVGGPEDMINILIQAVQEQLGLKIDTRKTPVEMVVVDRVEKIPVEN